MMEFGRFGYGRGFMGHGFSMIPHMIGALFCVALLTLLIIFIVKRIRHKQPLFFSHPVHENKPAGNALAILNERYAKGEIGDEDYQKIKAEISKP